MSRAVAAGLLAAVAVACLGAVAASCGRRRVLERIGRPSTPDASWRRLEMPQGVPLLAGAVSAWFVGREVGGVALGLAAVATAATVPAFARRRRSSRRASAVQEQLAEGVSVIASGLRAGRSLAQAVELAAGEIPAPLGPTFGRVADRVALGDPLEDALDAWAIEVGGPDARVTAGVFALHRRTGGALSGALEGLAATLRARRSAARELRSLTAQARLSAAILGLLPIGFFLFLSVVARSDVEAAFGTPVGSGAVIFGFALQGCAFLWIRRLLRVEP